jgi:hypothetical protein
MADCIFDAMWKQASPQFFTAFGSDGGLEYLDQGSAQARTISAIKIDSKPVVRRGTSDNNEFEEWRWRISSIDDSVGRADVKVLGFRGQAGDRVQNLNGKTWYVVNFDAENDPASQVITLRDKAIPFEQENE